MRIKQISSTLPAQVVKYKIVPDTKIQIVETLKEWADQERLQLILTTGGTGISPRDITPDATLEVLDRTIPGLVEAMRITTFDKTPRSILSRAVAGQRGKCLIINLPGSVRGVEECLNVILPVLTHAIELINDKVDDCGVQ